MHGSACCGGNLLEVLILTWTVEGWGASPLDVAETRQIAEGFLSAVCDWGSEVCGEILVFDGATGTNCSGLKSASFENRLPI